MTPKPKQMTKNERLVDAAMVQQGRRLIQGDQALYRVSRKKALLLTQAAALDLKEHGNPSVMIGAKSGLIEKFQIKGSKRLLSPIDAWVKIFKP